MVAFDPKKDLSDKTYWYPDGLFNEHGRFLLVSAKNASVMRYVWHACLLPTTVEDYTRALGIPANGLPDEVKTEIKEIIRVYADMKQASTHFRDVTWPLIIAIVDRVYTYSSRAGGRYAGSYYYNMLDWVRKYNREALRDHPDANYLEELKLSVMGACKKQIEDIDGLKTESGRVKDQLSKFKIACVEHENKLDPIIHIIQEKLGTLSGGGGKIAETRADIKKKKEALEQEIKEYDRDVVIAATTPAYVWVTIVGCVAAITVAAMYGDKARRLEKAIKELREAIEKEEADLKAMVVLEAYFITLKNNLSGIREEIDGAIADLARHEGVWESIKGRLQGLKGWVAELENDIEPTLLEEVDLENIVEHWNQLAKSADDYRLHAFEYQAPQPMAIEDYLLKLREKF